MNAITPIQQESSLPVVVIGAGPVGLAAAALSLLAACVGAIGGPSVSACPEVLVAAGMA